MSVEVKASPAQVICNTVVCCAALVCLITGIAFLTNPEGTGRKVEEARLIGTILTAVGGTVIGLQILVLLALCFCACCLVAAS